MKKENEISMHIVDCAIEVHRTLGGPGLLENVYEEALIWELKQRNIPVKNQINLPVYYKRNKLNGQYRLDLLVDECVIVECKATTQYNTIYESQLLTYLRLSELNLGLVINFGESLVKNGIRRVINSNKNFYKK
ncbi:MAG: GxxExxY protein [Desulfobulbaceae bacterium]|uniref:GxxExxY protein n=1 Tax=Candidatus Desulfobia pelagia TaxID=2841692 RepID=A0A8J6TFM8_9BACT|nr:GxxExxY protein [Candidatus Desulfobia pelagia]